MCAFEKKRAASLLELEVEGPFYFQKENVCMCVCALCVLWIWGGRGERNFQINPFPTSPKSMTGVRRTFFSYIIAP